MNRKNYKLYLRTGIYKNFKKLNCYSLAIILLLNICICVLPNNNCKAAGNIIYVDDDGGADFESIQDAIDVAEANDTIYVYAGIYYENILIEETINLIGENKQTTIIDGDEMGDVVYIVSDSVTIKNFTIRNSSNGFNAGIIIDEGSNIIVTDNIITNNGEGIYISSSSFNLIRDNIFTNNNDGLYLAISGNNSISENTFNNNIWYGIILEESNNNTLYCNMINGSNDGMCLESSINNLFNYNTIKNNTYYGITLEECSNNTITNNTISNNYDGVIFWPISNCNIIKNNTIELNNNTAINISQYCNKNIIINNNILYNDYALWIESKNNSIRENNILYNDKFGIYFIDTASGNIVNNNYFAPSNLSSGEYYCIYNENVSEKINATYNCWGFASGPYHSANGYKGDISVFGNVSFSPWFGPSGGEIKIEDYETYETAGASVSSEIFVTVSSEVRIKIGTSNSTNISVVKYDTNPGEDMPTEFLSIGKFFDVELENEDALNWINISIYYSQDSLNDSGLNVKQLKGLYYWDNENESWQMFNLTGVNSTNQSGFIGYFWTNTTHLTPIVPCGSNNSFPNCPENPSPSNGRKRIGRDITLKISVSDPDGDNLNAFFYWEGGTLIGSDINVINGSQALVSVDGLQYGNNFRWYVIVNDGEFENISNIWSFTTKSRRKSSYKLTSSLQIQSGELKEEVDNKSKLNDDENKKFLFDVILDLTPESTDNDDINAMITLINVGESGEVNGNITYNIYNDGKVIWTKKENVTVFGQKVYIESIPVEDFTPGEYTYEIVYEYGESQIASSQSTFTIKEKISNGFLLYSSLLLLGLIVAIFSFLTLFYYKKRKKIVATN